MVLFLLRSARSPWKLLHCGRRWAKSSSADCACQMQLPKAFVFRQLIFGINANPHYKSFISLCLRLGVAASRPSCGLWYVFCRSSSSSGFFAPNCPAFFLLCLKYAWARGVCLRTPVGLMFAGRRQQSCGPRCQLRGDCRARTGSEAASGTRKRSTSHTARVCAAAQLRGRV